MTLYGFWYAAKSEVVVDHSSLRYRGGFRERTISLQDIESVNVWGGNIIVNTRKGKNLAIPAVFKKQGEIALEVQQRQFEKGKD